MSRTGDPYPLARSPWGQTASAPDLSPAEAEIVAAFETAPTPPEVREAAVVEEVARAIHDDWCVQGCAIGIPESDYRAAAAAVVAYRAQDGGAEEAVRRQAAEYAWSAGYESCRRGDQKRNPYRAALAPQAGDGAR